jgi:predicted peptidase
MIVAIPQSPVSGWQAGELKKFIEYLTQTLRVNPHRIYVVGYSMGGYGVCSYVGSYGIASHVAAGVSVSGGGWSGLAKGFAAIPLWGFHGDADTTVPVANTVNFIQAIRTAYPASPARLTVFSGQGHGLVGTVFYGEGLSEATDPRYDPFDQSVWDWLIQYRSN